MGVKHNLITEAELDHSDGGDKALMKVSVDGDKINIVVPNGQGADGKSSWLSFSIDEFESVVDVVKRHKERAEILSGVL